MMGPIKQHGSHVLAHAFPEIGAGGYSRRDGTVEFFGRVNALLRKDDVVLDFGAGRGAFMSDPVPARRELALLRGKARRVVGADIDAAVLRNESLDDAVVLPEAPPFPFEASTFDVVVSDHTFEHLNQPTQVARELGRILRPGGWLCARTPYRWGSTGLATNIIPNRLHIRLLRHLQPQRHDVDVFPTRYRLNTRRSIQRNFAGWRDCSYLYTPEPAYLTSSRLSLAMGRVVDAVLPGPVLMIFMQKPWLGTAIGAGASRPDF